MLEQQGETDHKSVFIDSTKIESQTGRYPFVWRGTAEKNLTKIKKKVMDATGCTTLSELEVYLSKQADHIIFVSGKGKHKTEAQKDWESVNHLLQQWR